MNTLPFRQIHLDFHTSEQITEVGDQFDAEAFVTMLKNAHVNSINLFAWCHHGMAYFDTKYPNRHPGLKTDLLSQQIDACHAAGIQCPIYVPVGWDEYVARTHPEWIERDVDGRPFGAGPLQAGWRKICLNTPFVAYFEERVIEVLEKFAGRIDGFWIDIIFQNPCCCTWCMDDMVRAGLKPDHEPDRWAYSDRVLEKFRERITSFIRRYEPDCLIFYNAGHIGPYIRRSLDTYTHLELESLPGCRGGWGYDHLPITVSFARTLGKECVGMTGKFHKVWGDFGGFKNQAALAYECFTTLAYGAKCCIGDQLHPCGELDPVTYDLVGKVYGEVEKKEPWCLNAEPVTEIGVLTPESAVGTRHYHLNPPIRGAYRMLTEGHYQFDVLDPLSEFARYNLLILPDEIVFDDVLQAKIDAYLAGGGKILMSHRSGMDAATEQFLIKGAGEWVQQSPFEHEFFVPQTGCLADLQNTGYALYGRGMWVRPPKNASVVADLGRPYFNRTWQQFCSHFHAPMQGLSGYPAAFVTDNVAYLSHPLFSLYYQHGVRPYRLLVFSAIERLLTNRLVATNAPTTAHITLARQRDERRYITHILHYIPEPRSVEVDIVEEVLPIYDVKLRVAIPERVRRAYLAPSMQDLSYEQTKEGVTTIVPRVDGHQMVVFEYE